MDSLAISGIFHKHFQNKTKKKTRIQNLWTVNEFDLNTHANQNKKTIGYIFCERVRAFMIWISSNIEYEMNIHEKETHNQKIVIEISIE